MKRAPTLSDGQPDTVHIGAKFASSLPSACLSQNESNNDEEEKEETQGDGRKHDDEKLVMKVPLGLWVLHLSWLVVVTIGVSVKLKDCGKRRGSVYRGKSVSNDRKHHSKQL